MIGDAVADVEDPLGHAGHFPPPAASADSPFLPGLMAQTFSRLVMNRVSSARMGVLRTELPMLMSLPTCSFFALNFMMVMSPSSSPTYTRSPTISGEPQQAANMS